MIFKSARYCTSLFERLLDKFSRVGLPDTIARIFSLEEGLELINQGLSQITKGFAVNM